MATYPNNLCITNDSQTFQDVQTVTPSDSTDLPGGICRAIYPGGSGTIKVTTAAGTTLTITIPAGANGFYISLAVSRIWATGTTCTNMLAFY